MADLRYFFSDRSLAELEDANWSDKPANSCSEKFSSPRRVDQRETEDGEKIDAVQLSQLQTRVEAQRENATLVEVWKELVLPRSESSLTTQLRHLSETSPPENVIWVDLVELTLPGKIERDGKKRRPNFGWKRPGKGERAKGKNCRFIFLSMERWQLNCNLNFVVLGLPPLIGRNGATTSTIQKRK